MRLSDVVDEAARKLFFTEPPAPPRLEAFSTIPPPEITVTETPLRAPAPQRPESPTHNFFAPSLASTSMYSMRDRQTIAASSSVTPTGSLRAPSFSNIDAEINAGLYEKFLLATSNVKRVGGSYQFMTTDPVAPVSGAREFPSIQNKSVIGLSGGKKRKSFNANSKAESQSRKQALLEASRRLSACTVDEFGTSCAPPPVFATPTKKTGPGAFMRKALRVISVGNTLKANKRLSQAY